MARGEYLGAKQFNKRAMELFQRMERTLPEVAEMAASDIAKKAVEYAKENIEYGRNMQGHSEFTPELTSKLSDGSRNTGDILKESGMLQDSIYVVDKLFSADSVVIVIGSYMPYAAYHEEGLNNLKIPGINGDRKIPARPFMKPAVERAINEAFRYGLESRIRKALDASAKRKSWKKFF